MMSNFRLLAGLTSFISNRCFSHFCANGPEGIFASSFIRENLQIPKSNPDKRHRDLGGIQRSSKFQGPKAEVWRFGAWCFSGCWMLEVGMSSDIVASISEEKDRDRNRCRT